MDDIEETGIAKAIRLAGSQTALARAIGGVTPQAVQKWAAQGFAPPERCREIEDHFERRVTRYELNPTVFGSPEDAIAAAHPQPEGAAP